MPAVARNQLAFDETLIDDSVLELPVGKVARVGRFRITRKAIEPGQVMFEKRASTRLYISLAEGEE